MCLLVLKGGCTQDSVPRVSEVVLVTVEVCIPKSTSWDTDSKSRVGDVSGVKLEVVDVLVILWGVVDSHLTAGLGQHLTLCKNTCGLHES